MTAYRGHAAVDLHNLLGIGHLVQPQLLCHLRTHLGRVAVDSLAAAYHDVDLAYVLDGCGQCIRGSEGISASKETVGEQPACVGSAIQALAYDLASTWRAHREHAYFGSRKLVFQAQCLLQGV